MPTLDIETTIYTQLLDGVLLAYPDWENAFAVGNILRYDNLNGTQNPNMDLTADGDYPRVDIWLRSGQTNLFEGDPTFATYPDENTPTVLPAHWLEDHSYTYRIQITSQLMNLGEPDTLGALTRAAIRKAGPRLGLSYITYLRTSWEVMKTDVDPEEGEMRWQTTLDLFVRCQIDGASLL